MSERRHRKKDDTWTQDELSSALRKKEERRHKKESSKLAQESPHGSARHKNDKKSSKTSIDKRYEEEEQRRHKSKREDRDRHFASDRKQTDPRRDRDGERRHRDEEGDEEYRREKERRRKERREMESADKRGEERSSRRSDKTYDENGLDRRMEKERRHKDRDERKQRRRDEDGETKERRHKDRDERKQRHRDEDGETSERRHKERREDKYSRALDVDSEQDLKRRERKEERRKRKEEEKTDERERRHRDKDKERSSRSKSERLESSEKSSSSIIREVTSTRSSGPISAAEDYNYDDEEFEDYEDDFEDDNETGEEERGSEVGAVIKAIKRENERVASARTSSARSEGDYRTSSEPPSSPHVMPTSINFKAAKKSKSKTSQRVIKRRNDLINLIQLDVIAFDLFDLPPVTEYNFYIKNFGSQNSRQISTQCNDDALTTETQTDFPDVMEKWTQNPQDGELACGGTSNEPDSNRGETILALMQEGSHRFGSFVNYASSLLDASFAEANLWSGAKSGNRSSLSCCESCTKFNTNLSYLQGRQILHTVFGDGGVMALSFGVSDQDVATRFDRKGIVTVWKPTNTEQPDKLLVCDALPVACCFVPHKNNLLFVGADDGSVLVYDLSEPSSMHQCIEIEKNKTTVLRNPTYTTGWQADVHTSPIVCLNPVGTFQSSNQIFSLEEGARICIWTVVEILSDIDDDVGLVPQGHVKLVKSTTIDATSRKSSSAELGCRATCAVCPDSSVFYVGTQSGTVLSLTRDKKLKSYLSHGVGEVTSISISRLSPTLMLVSYDDGSLSLFQIKQEHSIMTWSLSGPVLYCDWSNCRSSVFFALDSSNQFHVWDLMAMDSAPVVSDVFQHKTLRFCVDRQARKTTDLMVAYDSCSFEVHRISPHFTDSVTADEDEQMMSLVLSFG